MSNELGLKVITLRSKGKRPLYDIHGNEVGHEENFTDLTPEEEAMQSLKEEIAMATYSFCEPAHGVGRWHIRKLTEVGQKFGGGIDTASLCERVGPASKPGHNGWDLRAVVDRDMVMREDVCCRQCKEIWLKENSHDPT